MAIDRTKPVGSLAAEIPGSTRVLEQLGIDYCCGGGNSIKDACLSAGLDPEEVIRRIEQASNSDDAASQQWQKKSLTELIGYIIDRHHEFTRRELARIEELSAKVKAVHGEKHSELVDIESTFQGLKSELTTHMLKEEQVLFPYIRTMEGALAHDKAVPQPFFGTVKNPVRMMMMEHDGAGQALSELRTLSGDYAIPSDGCASFHSLYQALRELEADLHEHIHLENNILFPQAIAMEARAGGGV